jgi:hypothetical protein
VEAAESRLTDVARRGEDRRGDIGAARTRRRSPSPRALPGCVRCNSYQEQDDDADPDRDRDRDAQGDQGVVEQWLRMGTAQREPRRGAQDVSHSGQDPDHEEWPYGEEGFSTFGKQ